MVKANSWFHVRGGFSTAEALVAFMLLGVGVLSLAGAGAFAAGTLREASMLQNAVLQATLVLDSLAATPRPGRDSLQRGPLSFVWSARDSAGAVNIDLHVYWLAGGPARELRVGRRAALPPRRAIHAP